MKEYHNFCDHDLLLLSSTDSEAEEELINRYKRKVSICARRFYLFGGDNDDLVQEGMIALLKAIRSYRPEKNVSFGTYSEVCIQNRLRDTVFLSRYSEFLSLEEQDLSDSSFCDNDPETLIIENEHYEEFFTSFKNCLSHYEQSVLDMYLQGMNHNEIANRLLKTTSSVYNAIERIRSKFSAHITHGDISS